jgi:hypothetical protein
MMNLATASGQYAMPTNCDGLLILEGPTEWEIFGFCCTYLVYFINLIFLKIWLRA